MVTYQNIDETGHLVGHYFELDSIKDHILKTLASGENIIVGYVHLGDQNVVMGGHEITIVGYEQDENGNGYFICNDTDDDINEPIRKSEKELLPLIHHAGISKNAFSENDIVYEEGRNILDSFQASRNS